MALCECSDSGCPVHTGKSKCQFSGRTYLQRIDMYDKTGTLFCPKCASDAMESGLFNTMSRYVALRNRGTKI